MVSRQSTTALKTFQEATLQTWRPMYCRRNFYQHFPQIHDTSRRVAWPLPRDWDWHSSGIFRRNACSPVCVCAESKAWSAIVSLLSHAQITTGCFRYDSIRKVVLEVWKWSIVAWVRSAVQGTSSSDGPTLTQQVGQRRTWTAVYGSC